MSDRYKILDVSQSRHCCFEWTIVDTHDPVMIGDEPYVRDGVPQFMAICEGFDDAGAELCCQALNAKNDCPK